MQNKTTTTTANSSPYCPVNPHLSVCIRLQGRKDTSLAVGLLFSKFNTDKFICCFSVILDGSQGKSLSQFSLWPCLPHSVILLSLLLQHPRLAVLGSVRLQWLLIFKSMLTEVFFRRIKSKFTWLFMA